MMAKLLHFQLRPWTPYRFAHDVRQVLIGLSYQFPVLVEFFEDHNADQSARLAPTSDCGSNWLIMTARSRGTAVLSANATPIGLFQTGAELRTALLTVVTALTARSTGPSLCRLPLAAEGLTQAADNQAPGYRSALGQPTALIRFAEWHGASAMEETHCSTAPIENSQ